MLTFDAEQNCDGATWSEKLDGINAVWDGKTLVSRDGNTFDAPDWFLGSIPEGWTGTGEIWAGRGQFETVLSVVQRGQAGDWSRLVFVPFTALTQHDLTGTPADAMAAVVAKGGEGIVIHADGEQYKLKPALDDDAEVIGHVGGTGRNEGLLGSLVVRDRAGREFKLYSGLSFIERETPPAIGSIVTFSFCGRTRNGKPRHAVFSGTRFESAFV